MASRLATVVALVLVVSGLAISPQAAATTRRADLTVAAVSPSVSQVRQTAKLATRVKVRNTGKAKAPASVTSLSLSPDAKPGHDRKLKPTWATPALAPGRVASGKVVANVPATVAPGTYYVIACADGLRKVRESQEGNNCKVSRATVEVLGPPSSHDLIEDAVASGGLTPEQGLVYKVFSDFDDPRLPGKYVGTPNGLDEGALAEAADAWASLSAQTQSTLRPFLIPPFYVGSHWSPGSTPSKVATSPGTASPRRLLDSPWCSGIEGGLPIAESWEYMDTSGGEVRIWWSKKDTGDAATAAHLVAELEGKILPALVGLMGRGPKSDSGLCDGGSSALDIVLVAAQTATTYGDGSCGASGTAAHMVFPRTASGAGWTGLDPYLAHEVMHAIQFAMPVAGGCGTYAWLREMTAQWVQDYVTDPSYGIGVTPDDTEWPAAPIYLDNPDVPLDVKSPPANHDYGDYLLALWAARKGGPRFVKDVWDAAASKQPTQAIDTALPGGFEATWADFALSNWNQGPVTDYKGWDGLTPGAATIGPEPIPVEKPRNPSITVKHLAAKYLELDIDPKVKEVEFTNDIPGDTVGKVRAVITYDDGSDEIVDLSSQAKTSLCIDDGTKRATKVVIIFSNADLTTDKTFAPTLLGKKTCGCANSSQPRSVPGLMKAAAAVCGGDADITWTVTEHVTDEGGADYDSRSTTTGSMNLTMVESTDNPGNYESGPGSTYSVKKVTHSEVYRHSDNNCGDEIADITEEGSGELDPDAPARGLVVDSGDFWFNNMNALPTTWKFHNDVICIGPQDETMDSQLSTPECPPDPNNWDMFYEFTPAAPDSKAFTFSCTGDADYTDGLGRHQITVTVSGTLSLHQTPG